jgi:hypothetical protein
MRPTSFLRQVATATRTSPQRKLPLPNIIPPNSVPRLKPPQADFLPSLINCPTTLPPIFISPPKIDKTKDKDKPKKTFSWEVAKFLYWTAKSYFTFYKAGISQANSNRKIRKFLKSELMKSFKYINVPGSANIAMTRSEFQLCIRTKRDWRKMPRTSN